MAALNSDLPLVVEFFDENGDPHTPSPAATVQIWRINDDLTREELVASGTATTQITGNTSKAGYVLDASLNDATGTIEATFTTTDTGLPEAFRSVTLYVDVAEAADNSAVLAAIGDVWNAEERTLTALDFSIEAEADLDPVIQAIEALPEPLDAAETAAAVQTGLGAQGYTTTRAGYLDTLNGFVANLRDAVWNAQTSALTTAGSIGKWLLDNTGLGNIWLTEVDESYTGDMAGHLLRSTFSKVNSIVLDVISLAEPVDPETLELLLFQGTDYTVSSGRSLPEWTNSDWEVYNLTAPGTTVTLRAVRDDSDLVFSHALTVVSNTIVRITDLTHTQTANLVADKRNPYFYQILATLASGDVVPLAQGRMPVIRKI